MERYTNEAKRLYGVMNRQLATHQFMACSEYTIADIAIFPWLRSRQNQGVDWVDHPHLKNGLTLSVQVLQCNEGSLFWPI